MRRLTCKLIMLAMVSVLCLLPVRASGAQHKLVLLVYYLDRTGTYHQVKGAVVTACPDIGLCQTEVSSRIGRTMFQFPAEAQYVDVTVEVPSEPGMCTLSDRFLLTRSGSANDPGMMEYVFMTACP